MLDIPAIAVSAEGYRDGYDQCSRGYAGLSSGLHLDNGFCRTLQHHRAPLPLEAIGGVRITRLGSVCTGIKCRSPGDGAALVRLYGDELGFLPESGTARP